MIDLTISVQTESPLFIGGEVRSFTNAERPLLKTFDGYPYIPAPSIKGRLRHATENVLKAAGKSICKAPNPADMCRQVNFGTLCPACQLFGSPWYESRLFFQDLKLSAADMAVIGTARRPRTETRYSVSISRSRHVAQDKRLFTTELFAPGVPLTFSGAITYSGDDLVDLAPVILATREITQLGGSRTRGYGWCKITLYVNDIASGTVDTLDNVVELWNAWKGN